MSFTPFECIGLSAESEDEIVKLINRTIDKAKPVKIPHTVKHEYRLYEQGRIQVWYLIVEKELVSASPHFKAESQPQLGIFNYAVDEENAEGKLMAFIQPSEDLRDGLSPIVFRVPDFWLIDEMKFPFLSKVELVAFAVNISLFANEGEFYEKTGNISEFKLGVQSLIPSGLFVEKDEQPEPAVMFSGRVLKSEKLQNEETGRMFYHLVVESIETMDVVAPEYAFETEPEPGMIVYGDFILSGRIV